MRDGDIVRLKTWEHCFPDGTTRIRYSTRERKVVALFILIGHEPLKAEKELDIEAVMKRLGWVPDKP